MVYRLHKAPKSLFAKVLIVILIYSIVIGFIGWVTIGFAATFDTESFHYNLIDSNDSDPEERLLCESTEKDCDWHVLGSVSLANEIQSIAVTGSRIQSDFADTTRSRYFNGNYFAFNESITSKLFLAQARINLDQNGFWIDYKTSLSISNVSVNPSIITQFIDGSTSLGIDFCSQKSDLPGSCDGQLHLLDNIRSYLTENDTYLLASHVLLSKDDPNNVLCYDWWIGCNQYFPVGFEIYENDFDGTNISAFQALIKPILPPSLSGIVPSGTDTTNTVIDSDPNQVEVLCNFDNSSCDNLIFIDEISFELERVSSNRFVFVSSHDTSFLMTGKISLLSIINDESNEFIPNPFFELCNFIHPQDKWQENPLRFPGHPGAECRAGGDLAFQQVPDLIEPEQQQQLSEDTPKMVISVRESSILIKFAIISGIEDRNTLGVFFTVLTNPALIWNTLTSDDTPLQFIIVVSVGLIVLNVSIAFGAIIIQLWRLSGRISPNVALLFRGRLGRALELTQFFEFRGQWYLESTVIHDYDFKTSRGTVRELVRE